MVITRNPPLLISLVVGFVVAALFAVQPAQDALRATEISGTIGTTQIKFATALKEANAGQVGQELSWRYSTTATNGCMVDVYHEELHPFKKTFDVPCLTLTTDDLAAAMREAKTIAQDLIDKIIESISKAKEAPGM